MKAPVFRSDWSPEVQAIYRHDMQEIWDRRIAPHVWNQYHSQIDRYLAIAGNEPLRILDVGCAQGTLALLLAEAGHDVTAVDIRKEFTEYAKTRYTHGNIEFVVANILAGDISGEYDLVFANQLIEHLVYPDRLLTHLVRVLRPRGRVVISTPNGDYLRNTLPSYTELGDPVDWEHMQFTADGDGHFFAYRMPELLKVVTESGFTEVDGSYFESPFANGHMKLRYLHRFIPWKFLKAMDDILFRFKPLGSRLGSQIIVLAHKPFESFE